MSSDLNPRTHFYSLADADPEAGIVGVLGATDTGVLWQALQRAEKARKPEAYWTAWRAIEGARGA